MVEKLDSTLLMLPGSCGFRSLLAASCDAPSFWIPLGFRFHNVYHHHCIMTFKRQSQQTPLFFSEGIHQVILLRAKSLQSCLTLCDPMDCSPPGPTVYGISQARILECSAMGSSWAKDWTHVYSVSCIADRFFTTEPPGNPIMEYVSHAKSEKKYGCNSPGSAVVKISLLVQGVQVQSLVEELRSYMPCGQKNKT